MADRELARRALDCPAQWHRTKFRTWASPVACVAAVVLLAAGAVVAMVAGQYVGAAIAGAVALILLPIARSAWPRARSGTVRVAAVEIDGLREHGAQFRLRPVPPVTYLATLLLGVVLLGFAVAAVVLAITRGKWNLLIGFVVLGAFGSLMTGGSFVGLRGRNRNPSVTLTASRIVIDTAAKPVAIAWDSITGLRPFTFSVGGARGLRPIQRWLGFTTDQTEAAVEHQGQSLRSIPKLARELKKSGAPPSIFVDRLRVDPLILYHGTAFYLRHPGRRDELSGEEGTRRLLSGEL